MINIFNKDYYIDIDEAIKSCQVSDYRQIDNVEKDIEEDVDTDDDDDDDDDDIQINVFKFDIIKMCIDRVLNNYDENDDISSMYSENKSFKIAIATLIKNKILIELEDEDEFE